MTQHNTSSILITGSTGTIGSALTQILSAQQIPFRAMVRKPEDATQLSQLPYAEVIVGDFNDTTSIRQALQGTKKAFLLTNSSELAEQQQLGFVAAAADAGVQHIVKLSQLKADEQSPVRFLRYHAKVENAIKASGMAYTFLRPNLFMQGLLGFRMPIIHQGKFFATAGNARISMIDIRDIAAVAAAALTDDQHRNKTYTLTGAEAFTHEEAAAMLSEVLQRDIQYINVSDTELQDALVSNGFPAWQAEGLIEDYAHYARGEAADLTDDIHTVTGRTPFTFRNFVNDYADFFK
ncbi:MAG TPA: SDR family oxidoreductase [Chitinophaga sp.]|uniref:SDR family oxidoreductase n=1 Tax=Chitinophaga sp. TaxID=1869181 RepID=UPI002CCF02CE|nr:SDR family oxidoreductase [Chitinophaga sp.]HVI47061.1 SDR family oxidoreductase [Chitinophaga sp.]